MANEETILIVDDEENILKALTRVLRREPYRILTATSGQEGLEVLSRHPVDVVVSDQRMPRMLGVEFLLRVKKAYPDTVRIMLTGYTEAQSIADAVNLGNVYKFVFKPWEDEVLKDVLRECVEAVRLQRQNTELLEAVRRERAMSQGLMDEISSLISQGTTFDMVVRLMESILTSLPVALLGIDASGRVIAVNDLACRMAGAMGKEVRSQLVEELLGPEVAAAALQAASMQARWETTCCLREGAAMQVACVPLPSDTHECLKNGVIIALSEEDR